MMLFIIVKIHIDDVFSILKKGMAEMNLDWHALKTWWPKRSADGSFSIHLEGCVVTSASLAEEDMIMTIVVCTKGIKGFKDKFDGEDIAGSLMQHLNSYSCGANWPVEVVVISAPRPFGKKPKGWE